MSLLDRERIKLISLQKKIGPALKKVDAEFLRMTRGNSPLTREICDHIHRGKSKKFRWVCKFNAFRPIHSNGLQVLGTHHRAHAGAPGVAAPVAGDARDGDQVFAGRTDGDYLDVLVAQVALQVALELQAGHACDAGVGHHAGFVIVDEEIA